MSVIAWIVLGGIAGWIGSLLVNKTGEGDFLDIILGIVGGVVGGWIFSMLGSTGVTGFNLWSLFAAVVGAGGRVDDQARPYWSSSGGVVECVGRRGGNLSDHPHLDRANKGPNRSRIHDRLSHRVPGR